MLQQQPSTVTTKEYYCESTKSHESFHKTDGRFWDTFETVTCLINHLLCLVVADGSQTTDTQTLEHHCERNPLPLCIHFSYIFQLSSYIAVNQEWVLFSLCIATHYSYVPSESFLQHSGQGGLYGEGHQQPTPSAN